MIKKLWKVIFVFAMVFSIVSPNLFSDTFAKTTTQKMAHLKSGSDNGNAHFGDGKAEAFALSDKESLGNEQFSFQMKLTSETSKTRFRFVTNYVDDSNWSYIAYDGLTNNWFCEYKNGDKTGYPGLSGDKPIINKDDIVNVVGVYQDDKLVLSVENVTKKTTNVLTGNNPDFIDLSKKSGKVGFGAATFGSEFTDVYFSNVKVGTTEYKDGDYNAWSIYKGEGKNHTWEPSIDVSIDDGSEVPPVNEGRTWYKITAGANNGGGHDYGKASSRAPILLLDNDKKMEEAGSLSMSIKPSDNWGVFYTYVDDNNWLYIGRDSQSSWYYQYKVDGNGEYPKISGLPTPVVGEEMNFSVSLSRETLSVSVNGTAVQVTNQKLIALSDKLANKGRFGVKTNGATSISFADVKYNDQDCMKDNWVFAAERAGQLKEIKNTQLYPVSGKIVDSKDNTGVQGATVRIGANSTKTSADGTFSFSGIENGTYAIAVTKLGYKAYEDQVTISDTDKNEINVTLSKKAEINLDNYDKISSGKMDAYIGKDFPLVARYVMADKSIFRGNENVLDSVTINKTKIKPTVTVKETTGSSRTYQMVIKEDTKNIDFTMDVKVSVKDNTLTWEVVNIEKAKGCVKIATIDIPGLNLLSVDAADLNANFAGAKTSTTTTVSGDSFIDFEKGFVPSNSDDYLYGFLTNEKLSAGLYSNSEIEGDKRVIRNNGADTISLTSAAWYYEQGDKQGQTRTGLPEYPTSELPCTKVAIGNDLNDDKAIDWNDGAIAFRSIMNIPYESENVKNLVNNRIVMNFASMASNPYLVTADNIKKVALATDGLPQAVMLKGYGNEGHDSANSEYADIAEREGGVTDFQSLIKIAHDYNTEVGIHVNAQEIYPEAPSFNEDMLQKSITNGWGWLDQSVVIDKQWDLASQARWKRFVQLYDRINETDFYDRKWPEAVKDSKGTVKADKSTIKKDAESRPNNMDFIYLDVWYQDAWETRQIAKEINSLGWRFSTEFSDKGEYDSTWQHWATDASYGGATMKGFNSDIIRFIRNDQRDSQVLNYPKYGGTADNPLLGGYRLYGFEGWGGDQDFNNYILQTFNQNLPTKFLQHYNVTDWENYENGKSPVGNKEKQITLKNDKNDTVIVTRNEKQRSDENIERTITLNGKKVLDDVTYLLPWTEEDGNEKLYHWNLDGGTTTWELQEGWNTLSNINVYELSDQGRSKVIKIPVVNGTVTLTAKNATAYVIAKGEQSDLLKNGFGESDYVKDPGFNAYAEGSKLASDIWQGDIKDESVKVSKANTGDQRLTFANPTKDVDVSTKITGLKPGTNYVAEVYVENNSDVKATIDVNTGTKNVSNYTERSILNNYVKSDQKHDSKMQRMQISFKAESRDAKLTLSREAGLGETYIDDIRIVEKTLDNFQKDGSFKQDYETVVQGLYPFVLSYAQGVSDPATHLSQLNAPYTQAGWNGRVIDDVIDGNWSLKHHDGNTGIIYQTLPQNYRFEAGKVYTIEFDYQAGPNKAYAMVVGDGMEYNKPVADQYLASAKGKDGTKHVTMNIMGSDSGQTWIGLYQNGALSGSGSMGERDFVLDNLVIKENSDAVFADIKNTSLYKGEVAKINGNKLAEIEWESSNEKVIKVNTESFEVNALSAGTATLTATYPDGTVKEFKFTISDSVVVDVDRAEFGKLSVTANTEQLSGEPEGSGVKEAVIDGNSSTYWHSQWSGSGFVVSPENPAIISVSMENPIVINGFKFQQRPSGGNNGVVQQFSYQILDADGKVIYQGDHIVVDKELQSPNAIVEVEFASQEKAATIKLLVEKGYGNFASVAEISPIRIQKVADTAEIDDFSILVGSTKQVEVKHPENTILKGIVWNSSDTSIATVSQTGELKAIKAGTVSITVQNAAGLYAKAEVKVKAVPVNNDLLKEQILVAEAINLNLYEASIEKMKFISALLNAKMVLASSSNQTEIDQALKALQEAQAELQKLPIKDIESPTTPSNLIVSVEETTASLSWNASKDNVGVKGYNIYLNGKYVDSVAENKTTISNLLPKTTYFVEVIAYDEANNLSNILSLEFTTKEKVETGNGNTPETPGVLPPALNNPTTNTGVVSNKVSSNVITNTISEVTKEKTTQITKDKEVKEDVPKKATKETVEKEETPKANLNNGVNNGLIAAGIIIILGAGLLLIRNLKMKRNK